MCKKVKQGGESKRKTGKEGQEEEGGKREEGGKKRAGKRGEEEGGTPLEVHGIQEPIRVLLTALVHSFLSCP